MGIVKAKDSTTYLHLSFMFLWRSIKSERREAREAKGESEQHDLFDGAATLLTATFWQKSADISAVWRAFNLDYVVSILRKMLVKIQAADRSADLR